MGYYINPDSSPRGKAQKLVELHDATILPLEPEAFTDLPDDKALVCVVDNGPVEAAALCYSEREFEAFREPDTLRDPNYIQGQSGHFDLNPTSQRPRTWVMMNKQVAYELAGYKGE